MGRGQAVPGARMIAGARPGKQRRAPVVTLQDIITPEGCTIAEYAEMYHISEALVRDGIRTGEIPARTIGRRVVVLCGAMQRAAEVSVHVDTDVLADKLYLRILEGQANLLKYQIAELRGRLMAKGEIL